MITLRLLTVFFVLVTLNLYSEDIKPAEYKEMTVIGTGPTINSSMASCYQRMFDSCKQIQKVQNRDSQSTGSGWITTYTVTYKVVH